MDKPVKTSYDLPHKEKPKDFNTGFLMKWYKTLRSAERAALRRANSIEDVFSIEACWRLWKNLAVDNQYLCQHKAAVIATLVARTMQHSAAAYFPVQMSRALLPGSENAKDAAMIILTRLRQQIKASNTAESWWKVARFLARKITQMNQKNGGCNIFGLTKFVLKLTDNSYWPKFLKQYHTCKLNRH